MDNQVSKINLFVKLAKKYKKKLIYINSIIFILAIIFSLLLPLWYKSTATLLIKNDDSAFGLMSGLSNLGLPGFLGGGGADHNRYLSILYSRSLMESVINKYNLIDKYEVKNMEEAVESVSGNIDVEVGDEMQVFVSFYDTDQEKVAEMTSFIIQSLDSINIQLASESALKNRDFISSRISIVLDSLNILEQEIKDFFIQNGVLDLTSQVVVGLENAALIQAELMQREIELDVAEKQTSQKSSIVQNLETQIAALKNKYRSFFTGKEKNKLVPAFYSIPELQIRFTRLQRKVEYYVRVLEFLAPEYEQAKIKAAKDIPTIQMLDYPQRPERKAKPKRAFVVLGILFFSFTICMYYIYWKEYIVKNTNV